MANTLKRFSDEEKVSRLADILRAQYSEVYQHILLGEETSFLKSIASHLDMSEKGLMDALIANETHQIVTQIKISHDELEKLKDMVDRMRYAP
jgi:hypothetical protein